MYSTAIQGQPHAAVVDSLPRPWLKHYDDGVPTHLDYPRIPIWQILADSAAKYPDHTCVIFYGKRFNYSLFEEQSNQLGAGLRRLGLRKGDRIALLLPSSPQFLVAYYGALKIGAVVVPLNPLYTKNELTIQLAASEAETVITLPMFLEKVIGLHGTTSLKRIIVSRLADYLPLPINLVQGFRERNLVRGAGESLIEFKTLLQPAPDFRPEPIDPDDMAVLLFSGGTTGVAKGIMLSHFQCIALTYQATTWVGLSKDDRGLGVLPLFHGMGMSTNMNAIVLVGGEIVLLPRFNARDTLKAIHKFKPTFFAGVPTMFVAFNNLPDFEQYDLRSLRGIIVGAAPMTLATKQLFEAKTGAKIVEAYGLTETVTGCMMNPFNGLQKIGSVGIPFPDMDAKIVSLEDAHDLPQGELGEIVVRGPTLMLGYYNNPEETHKTVVDGWLFTGDIGYMDEDSFFYITDRKKDLIIVGGFNVYPREIDEVLAQHPKVKEGVAVGVPDLYKGERIKVFVVLKDGEKATPEELIAYFHENLAGYKVPSEVEFRTDLPKSMIGKILRRVLREEEIHKQVNVKN